MLTALGELWLNGIEPHWKSFYEGQVRSKVWLPSYVFDRKPCWVDPPIIEGAMKTDSNHTAVSNTINTEQNILNEPKTNINTKIMRKPLLLKKIADIIEDNSGVEIEANEADQSFLELGLDSLVLTQMAITCKNEFNVPITFRQLNDEFGSPNLLAEHLDSVLPAEAFAPATNDAAPVQQQQQQARVQQQIPIQQSAPVAQNVQNTYAVSQSGQNPALNLIAQQLQLLGQQLQLLQGGMNNVSAPAPSVSNIQSTTTNEVKSTSKSVSPLINTNDDIRTEEEKKEHQKPFGASQKLINKP